VDVVGLYLDPPEHAVVRCVDEKGQIQALQRTQPCLPIKKGRCGTLTHDYRGSFCSLADLVAASDGTLAGPSVQLGDLDQVPAGVVQHGDG